MSTRVQHRRGTTAQHAAFTGAIGEITYDVDKKAIVAHDGNTPGGFPAMRERTYDPAGRGRGIAAWGQAFERLAVRADGAARDLTGIDVVEIERASTTSDYCSTIYVRQASEPAHSYKFQDVTGAWFGLWGNRINALHAGIRPARTDASTVVNNRTRTALAIAALNAMGGGTLFFPAGTYYYAPASNLCINMLSGVSIEGEGMGLTTIKLIDGNAANAHMININNCDRVAVKRLTIDGNWENVTNGGHGVRIGGTCFNVRIEQVEVCYIQGYMIGSQAQSVKHCRIVDCYLHHNTTDGVDFKNFANGNEDIVIQNVRIHDWSTLRTDQVPAIDCRGPITVINPNIRITTPGSVGIRIRHGDDVQGVLGGAFGQVIGGFIYCAATSARGIEIFGPNIRVIGTTTMGEVPSTEGISIRGHRAVIMGTVHHGHNQGVILRQDYGSGANIEGVRLSGVQVLREASAVGGNGIVVGTAVGAVIDGAVVRNHSTGILINTNASLTTVRDSDVTGNSTPYSDSGTGSKVFNTLGVPTTARVSALVSVAAVGNVTFSIPHGLPSAPDVSSCLVRIAGGGNISYVAEARIRSTDATNINGTLQVTTAVAATNTVVVVDVVPYLN